VSSSAGKHVYEVDAGAAFGRNMTRRFAVASKRYSRRISNHIDGLGEVGTALGGGAHRTVAGNRSDWRSEAVDGFNLAYTLDAGYHRVTVESNAAQGRGSVARSFDPPVRRRTRWWSAGPHVTMFSVHPAGMLAVGCEYGGRSVVISGDTAKSSISSCCARRRSAGTRSLIARTRRHSGQAAVGRANVAQIMGDILDYPRAGKVAQIAAAANVPSASITSSATAGAGYRSCV
jgi:hypothetical protein